MGLLICIFLFILFLFIPYFRNTPPFFFNRLVITFPCKGCPAEIA